MIKIPTKVLLVDDEKDFIEFMKLKTEQDSVDIVAASQQIIGSAIVDSVAMVLQNYRQQSIKSYLATVSDSTEIKVFIPDPKSPKNVAAEPHFDVKYSMKESAETDDSE